jgi:Protein of unknown function (DUF1360)
MNQYGIVRRTLNYTLYYSKRWATFGYVAFIGLFGLEMAICSMHIQAILALAPWQLGLLGFAAYRGARAISYNEIFAWLRRPFCRVMPDSSGAGDGVEPKYEHGLMGTIGACLSCPICTGTHVGSFVLTLIAVWPNLGITVMYGLAIAGMAEFIHWAAEMLEWRGREARENAGTQWLNKNRGAGHQRLEPVENRVFEYSNDWDNLLDR